MKLRNVLVLLTLIFLTSPTEAATAYFKYERVSGLTKLCFYDYLGSEYVLTVRNYELCPLTIQVNP